MTAAQKDYALAFGADKDMRKVIEALQAAFDDSCQNAEVTTTGLAKRVGMDASALSRILNGKNQNLKLLTLATILRGLDKRMEMSVVDLADVAKTMTNHRKLPDVECPVDVALALKPASFRVKMAAPGDPAEDAGITRSSIQRRPMIRPLHVDS